MRVLKKEIMESEEEAFAYDLVVNKYVDIVNAGFAETVINLSPSHGSFLEIGTGSGRDAILIAKNTYNIGITALDLSDAMLKLAIQNARRERVDNKINFIKGDAKSLPFDDGAFDAVFCHNMLHHLPQPEKMLSEIKRVVKSDGAIIIRDLIRYSKILNAACVNILGINYNKTMREEYRKSILASYSKQEWLELKDKMNLFDLRFTKQFMTHVSIERVSARRRTDYIKVASPFYKRLAASFYISRPKNIKVPKKEASDGKIY